MMDNWDDNVRFSLSDDTGDLQFTAFDIVNTPECTSLVDELRTTLFGRPLAQLDVADIQRISCPGNGQCVQTIVRTIMECKDMFLRNQGQNKPRLEAGKKA